MPITVVEFMSLDGVVQAPGGAEEDTDGGFAHGGWSFPFFDPEVVGGGFDAAIEKADALLYGRRTWQGMAAAWPERTDDDDPFTTRMNSIKKYVVTSTLGDADLTWNNSHRIPGEGAIDRLRELRGAESLLIMGSPSLVRSLMSEGLVDELRLMIEPVVLGGGKRIFPEDGRKQTFALESVKTSPNGVQVCVYRAVAD